MMNGYTSPSRQSIGEGAVVSSGVQNVRPVLAKRSPRNENFYFPGCYFDHRLLGRWRSAQKSTAPKGVEPSASGSCSKRVFRSQADAGNDHGLAVSPTETYHDHFPSPDALTVGADPAVCVADRTRVTKDRLAAPHQAAGLHVLSNL